ncbi:MAG: UbiD family decarboxylase [Phycisphaeraceae bacterium]|nr:UbiD family decarboxylase [Phycisphaeraceae bacterium]
MFRSVRELIGALDRLGELRRIRASVSPVLEIAAIADRVSKLPAPNPPGPSARASDPRFCHLGGPALLFENVVGSDLPVLINAFGSYRRIELALGCGSTGLGGLAARLESLVKPEPPRGLAEALTRARELAPLLRIGPRRARRAPCQDIVVRDNDVDLTRLPLLRCWPLDGDLAAVGWPGDINRGIPGLGHAAMDGQRWETECRGRYITLGGVHTIHADDEGDPRPRSHNIGMYRVQLLGRRTMAMHWHVHHDGAAHWRSWVSKGRPMPVAIALGGESMLPYAATAPLPPGMSELLMAGFLAGRGVQLTRAATVPLRVPANAEIVIEGYVSHEAGPIGFEPRGSLGPGAVAEGPFGDHTGFYSLPDRYPILTVTAVTQRAQAVYPTTIVGLPPQEDYFLGKATERLFLPLLRVLIPDILDYDLPMFGAFHNCAIVKINKAYPLHARRVMHAIWGAGQMAWTKLIIVVDGDVDPHDHLDVLRAVSQRCLPARDLEFVRGPLDILDHAAPRLGAGTKLGFDATRKISGEDGGSSDWRQAPRFPVDAAARERALARIASIPAVVRAAWPPATGGWLFLSIDKFEGGQASRVVDALSRLQDLPSYIALLGADIDPSDIDAAMFHVCAHADASRDVHTTPAGIVIDATPKLPGDERNAQPVRDWPPMIQTDDATRALVDRRWSEYGLADLTG